MTSAPATAESTSPSRRRGTRRRSALRRRRSIPAPGAARGAARRTWRPMPAATCGTRRRGTDMLGPGPLADGTSAATPLWASLVGADRHHLRGSGSAQPRLHERPPVYRRGDCTGLVQRHHARQQRHVVLAVGPAPIDQRRRWRSRLDRLRLLGRPGLRPDDRPRHAQRHAAGAGADARSPIRRCRSAPARRCSTADGRRLARAAPTRA